MPKQWQYNFLAPPMTNTLLHTTLITDYFLNTLPPISLQTIYLMQTVIAIWLSYGALSILCEGI